MSPIFLIPCSIWFILITIISVTLYITINPAQKTKTLTKAGVISSIILIPIYCISATPIVIFGSFGDGAIFGYDIGNDYGVFEYFLYFISMLCVMLPILLFIPIAIYRLKRKHPS